MGKAIVVQAYEALKGAMDDMEKVMAASMVVDQEGASKWWKALLPSQPTWKQYQTAALAAPSKLKPGLVQTAKLALEKACSKYMEDVESFNKEAEKELIDKAEEARQRAAHDLVVGAVVALLANPPGDKVAAHKALQAQARAASKLAEQQFDSVFLDTLRKQVGFAK